MAHKVVYSYVSRKSIPQREEDDVVMAIIEKFLLKQHEIFERFKGESKFSTYCIAVLNRMCCEVIRNQKKDWNLSEKQDFPDFSESLSQTDLLLIQEEIKLLERILFLFGDEKHKIYLFKAYYFRLNIIEIHVKLYDASFMQHKLNEIFLVPNTLTKGEIFEKLANVVLRVEGKDMKPDAVRMWMNKCRTIIIDRLNTHAMARSYDNESFQALFEYSYETAITAHYSALESHTHVNILS